MNLYTVNADEHDVWNEIVRSFSNYDVFYLNEYARAFESQGAGEPILFYYKDDHYRAINVVMKRDIALDKSFKGKVKENKYYDMSSPYGYGGFLSEGEVPEEAVKEYEEYCSAQGYISEFVRFQLFSDYREKFSGKAESHTQNVIRDLQIPLEDIWMDFEHKVRKNIKKAIRSGLEIMICENEDHLDDFLSIYYSTMDRTGAEEDFYFNREFFEKINKMKGNFAYFYVLYENKIISTELVIYGTENAYSYLGGTDSQCFGLRPNDFLKFEIIKWAKEKGLRNFILGGGYGKDDGIFKYKKAFSPNNIQQYFIGKKIFDINSYKYLCSLRGIDTAEINEEGYFPLYRAKMEEV